MARDLEDRLDRALKAGDREDRRRAKVRSDAEAQVKADEAMAERHHEACEEAQERRLAEFLDHLRAHYVFAVPVNETELYPTCDSPERILARYFGIDMNAVERHRRRLLQEARERSKAGGK